jgi:Fic family protein
MPKEQKRLASTTVEAVNNLASLWDQIDQARASAGIEEVHVRRPGGVTVAEYVTRYHTGPQTAQRQLMQMVKDGLMKAERAFVVTSTGKRAHSTVYYPVTK